MTEPGAAAGVPGPSGLPGRVRTLCSPPPPGRLSSLRTRDLTLGGGFKKTKKTFEPNVHAVRRTKDDVSRSKEDVQAAPRKDRRERDERRREGRGRRKDRPQTIQSHSIFEQGPADSGRRAGWRAAPDPQGSGSSPVCRTMKKERREAEDDEDEDQILSKLQRDDFIDDPGLKNDDKLKPVQLPLSQSPPPAAGGRCGSARSGAEKPSIAELLRGLRLSGGEELFFMQLPDCMPGRAPAPRPGPGPGPERPAKREARSEERRTAAVPAPTVVLSDFPEGFLGKLQVRRSGKLQLRLGDVVMDVSEGAAFSFLQLVSVRLSEGNTGDMMVLGNVHHKLVLSPDFQALLQ
ncbi:DNA-directed RNA polymerase III subunit RPC4 isoform X5 [Salarias fasciatus]|uniref:DNA-directed RNA polymerase III subunit RPC4 isoform X5 n=1 Tax=Salarias fasciatus TaxID=181472 RepID=UPI0011767369|nr:DNA-directed RNA polymerase III subunit RPC4-like isoform X5 [Salarias fasciatus]